nr:STAS domain-containing protein [Geodermatophilaceae bacterium]
SAAALALVSYLETVSAGSSFARRVGGRIEPNGELVAIGGGNLAAGLFGGFPVASGFARTAVAFQAGARTPMTALLAAAVVAAALLTLSPVLALLPTAALAAVIIVAVATLVDLRGVAEVARVRRSDLVALLATFAVTAAFGPVTGIGVGVAVSLVLLLRQSARPHFPELGRVPGTARYRSLARHDPLAADPAVLLMRLDAPLYFGNAVPVVDRIVDKVARRPGLAHVVLDASGIGWLDYTGAGAVAEVHRALAARGVALHLAAERQEAAGVLARTRQGAWLAANGRLHADVGAAVSALGLDPESPLLPPALAAPPEGV